MVLSLAIPYPATCTRSRRRTAAPRSAWIWIEWAERCGRNGKSSTRCMDDRSVRPCGSLQRKSCSGTGVHVGARPQCTLHGHRASHGMTRSWQALSHPVSLGDLQVLQSLPAGHVWACPCQPVDKEAYPRESRGRSQEEREKTRLAPASPVESLLSRVFFDEEILCVDLHALQARGGPVISACSGDNTLVFTQAKCYHLSANNSASGAAGLTALTVWHNTDGTQGQWATIKLRSIRHSYGNKKN